MCWINCLHDDYFRFLFIVVRLPSWDPFHCRFSPVIKIRRIIHFALITFCLHRSIQAFAYPMAAPLRCVRLQNLPWYKTGLVSRQALHLLSKLQNWICPKSGQYKTCLVSNTKIEAWLRATKPKPWQSRPLQNRICVDPKPTTPKRALCLLQNQLRTVPKPAAPKPALCLRSTCRTKTGFASAVNLPFHFE